MTGQTRPEATVELASGVLLPQVGLGTWPMVGAAAYSAVECALRAGYRLIDTSEQYANEEAVGKAIRDSELQRSDIFVTTKFNVRWHGFHAAQRAYARALERMGLEYVDLFLIHWPNPWEDRYVEAWRGLIALRDAGRVGAIGTSNFLPEHLERLVQDTGVASEVNQIELDPTLPQHDTRAYHLRSGIATQAWGPLGRDGSLFEDPVVVRLANLYGKSPAQVVLRWHLQQGHSFTVRSSNPERIEQNIDLFDFALSLDDLAAMSACDRGRAPGRDPRTHGH